MRSQTNLELDQNMEKFRSWFERRSQLEKKHIAAIVFEHESPAMSNPEALQILEFLNKKRSELDPTKRGFKANKSTMTLIAARLKEGATPADCRGVIATKARQVRAGDFSLQYFRPETLFNSTKFGSYCGELGA